MYVICGATGNTGSVVAVALLTLGKKVRVIGRSREKLQGLIQSGAEAFVADMEDAEALTKAFSGATAVYVLLPPNMIVEDFRAYQNRVSDAISIAVQKSGVKYAVILSSIGGNHPSGTGPVVGLYELEQKLKKIPGLNVLAVRAAFFMENFLMNIGLVKSLGIMGAPAAGDVPMPMIASSDIGKYAAERLSQLDFTGFSLVNLHGPLLTFQQVTSILGNSIGRPDLPYTQFSYDDAERGLIGMGVKPQMAALYIEMYKGAAAGKLMFDPSGPQVSTPTTLEEFSQQFAAAYRTK
jgi:uncharacterized protein YbjT (DUF2867 family)